MIKIEILVINDVIFTKTTSDQGYKIEREGVLYDEAIDPAYLNRSYTETTEPILKREN